MNVTMRSNAIKDGYYGIHFNKTVQEIFETMIHVYGPGAENIFINPNKGNAYHTRDGKVCLENLIFDNPIATDIRNLFMQAVIHQSDTAGDGTTTMTLFYAAFAKALRDYQIDNQVSSIKMRKVLVQIIEDLRKEIKEFAVEIKPDGDEVLQMLYTTIQDESLVKKVYEIISQTDKETLMDVKTSDSIDGIEIEISDAARLEGEVLFSLKPVNEGTIEKSTILYIDGLADISSINFIDILANTEFNLSDGSSYLDNIWIACAELTDSTKHHLKEYLKLANGKFRNNVIFYKIKGYRDFKPEHKSDLTSVIYNLAGTCGLTQGMTFEAYVANVITSEEYYKENYGNLDVPMELYQVLKESFTRMGFGITYDKIKGIKLEREIPDVAKHKLEMLREKLKTDNSPFHQLEYKERIRRIYGKYVLVNVGSKMLKDRQRESELILDGIISSQRALENGILKTNGVLAINQACRKLIYETKKIESPTVSQRYRMDLLKMISSVSVWMFACIIDKSIGVNNVITPDESKINKLIDALPVEMSAPMNINEVDIELDWSSNLKECIDLMLTAKEEIVIDGRTISAAPIEPRDTIDSILENLTMPFDIAFTNVFITSAFMDNYL